MQTKSEYIKQQARMELARRNLWDYCKLTNPQFYKENRKYLKDMCNNIEAFFSQEAKKFLIINLPPLLGTANLLQVRTQ